MTLLASITAEGVGSCLVVEGPTTREVFEACPERVLAPSLRDRRIVVLKPIRPQGRQGAQDRRGRQMRARLPATVLPGPQPHRAGLFKGQGATPQG